MPLKDPIEAAAYSSEYRKRNRTKVTAANRVYRQNNREKLLAARKRNYQHSRQRPAFILMSRVGNRFQSEVKRGRARYFKNIREITGCATWDELARYIESRFEPGMSWGNRQLWHIDHEVPCVLFDLNRLDHQEKCFHFTNLRPMWAIENLKKKHYDPASEYVLRLKAELDQYRRLYGPLPGAS